MSRYLQQNIAVIGAGLTGASCVQFLLEKGANVTVFDTREQAKSAITLPIRFGTIDKDALLDFDKIIVSPGVSRQLSALRQAEQNGVAIIGDIELFAVENQTPAIAVTGSNGKSTVVSLLGAMLKAAGKRVCISGNIGTPVLTTLNDPYDIYVLELSSFQLESTESLQLQSASILNLTEDHVDWHGSMAAYVEAKQRIFRYSTHAVVNRDDQLTHHTMSKPTDSFGLSASDSGMSWDDATQIILREGKPFIDFSQCQVSGLHNVLNIQAAALLALQAGVDAELVEQTALHYQGLEHRYQVLHTADNIRWINDSKATNCGAALVSIITARQETQGKLIVIVGGDAKQADLSVVQPEITHSVDYLIALGKDGRQFLNFAEASVYVDSMQQAVVYAKGVAKPGDCVLLAPACASLDMFQNFEQRGNAFAQAVFEVAA